MEIVLAWFTKGKALSPDNITDRLNRVANYYISLGIKSLKVDYYSTHNIGIALISKRNQYYKGAFWSDDKTFSVASSGLMIGVDKLIESSSADSGNVAISRLCSILRENVEYAHSRLSGHFFLSWIDKFASTLHILTDGFGDSVR